jgi:hypothetical protein
VSAILLALCSAPTSAAGRRALALAGTLAEQGHALTLCCLQDAALLASSRAPGEARAALNRLQERGARCVVLREDLSLRGLEPGPRALALGHAEVVELLAGEHHRVLGCL